MALHCPSTLVLARHGQATYDEPDVYSDAGGRLTPTGRDQVRALAEGLRTERVAAVRTSRMARAAESGALAAEVLRVGSAVIPGLEEVHVGDTAGLPEGDPAFQDVFDAWLRGDLDRRVPGAESGHEVVARVREALLGIADEFRGEQVLVVTHGGVMAFAVPRLCDNLRDDHVLGHGFVPNAVPLRLTVGDDGWTAGAWPA